ncbi:hypothetical protein BDP27DRAFT_1442203 [Rhodocollybia butyracea]|uniref:DH domain-containing protein n=1 Tax=Rhodocollybia butyracea TaxID=206335 RepID=A0A9P5Q2C1_9AGAR|nr:hypothetical protein BDP27DRAFT_1442203 [Rhodocollybia butyracea]
MHLSISAQPKIYDRRSSRHAFELSHYNPAMSVPIIPTAANSTIMFKRPVEGRSRRSTTTGFLPLPSISASPVCTPTTSTSSRDFDSRSGSPSASASNSGESYTTALATSPELSPSPRASPEWISVPPPPLPTLVKRSVTCVTSRLHSFSHPSSFPISMPLSHALDHSIQRRNSVPAPRARSWSDLYPSIGRWKPSNPSNPIASPSGATLTPAERRTHHFARPRPLFDFTHQVGTETDNDFRGQRVVSSSTIKPVANREKIKDDTRKYHALLELLSTEVSYMQDLRILVEIYLRQIPTLTLKRSQSSSSTFVRNSSFSALSRASSSVHLSFHDNNGLQNISSISANEREKSPARHIFKNLEIDMLTRNAEEVLQFHENFVEELRQQMAPFGLRMELPSERSSDEEIMEGSVENIDASIALVSTKFATEASRFTSYELFCAGHPEAMDIVRRVQLAHPTDWEAFERRCGGLAYEMINGNMCSDDSSPVQEPKLKSRRNSTASIDGTSRYVRSRSNSLAGDRESTSRHRSRLTFMDYLIKPVQRICKYPLLLEQLKTSQSLLAASELRASGRSDVNVIVDSATEAMRSRAGAVDEARRRQDVVVRSSLIASRIVYPHVMPSSLNAVLHVLTPSFVSSLGACHLAGSLDVIHQRSFKSPTGTANINVKYLGAFLYLGGYLILAKVKGKTYEPRHWFNLCDFKIVDAVESEALLPCSFRVTCKGHEFEFAASCQQEKQVWLTAVRESMAYPTSGWINEPIDSLHTYGKGELIPSTLDGPSEVIVPLPTIDSVPEVAFESGGQLAETLLNDLSADSYSQPKKSSRNGTSPEGHSFPSRRSSTASANATAEYETFIIRRNLPSARTQIEAGLRDVISDACFSVRSQATSREEELFQTPYVFRQGSPVRPTPNSRSNSRPSASSGLTNRLRKHESVRVPRKRSFIQNDDGPMSADRIARAKSLAVRKRPQKLNLKLETRGPLDSSQSQPQSPPSLSGCSSSTMPSSSNPPSTIDDSPTLEVHAYMSRAPRSEPDCSRSRPTSFVGRSVRSLFISRPPSPTRISFQPPVYIESQKHSKPRNVFRRWVGSVSRVHRRTLSASDVQQNDDGAPTLPEMLTFEPLKLTQSPTAI